MKFSELSKYEQKRARGCACYFCKQGFNNGDSVEFVKIKDGRSMIYSFFHTRCIIEDRIEQLQARAISCSMYDRELLPEEELSI